MEQGRFYLISSPWFWTFVGRYVRHVNFQEIELDDAVYFTRTGATFDVLAVSGMNSNSKYHPLPSPIIIPAQGLKIPWLAKTPWAKETPHTPKGRKISIKEQS